MTETAQPKWTVEVDASGNRSLQCAGVGSFRVHDPSELGDLFEGMARDLNAAEEQRHATEPGCACLCHADNTSCPYCEGGRHLPARSEVEGLLDSIGGDAYLCAQGDMEPVAAMVSIQKAVAALRSLSARPEVEAVIRAAWDHSCALDGDTSLTELHAALLALLDSQRKPT